MRPIYESDEDLSEEKKIVTDVCTAWGCEAHKLPISYHLDFLLQTEKGTPLIFLEIKRRNFFWNQYPDVIISLSKLITATNVKASTGLLTNFVVKSDDALMWFRLNEAQGRDDWIRVGGRTLNTRDSADIEPVVHIPVSQFKQVKWENEIEN